MDRFGYYVSLVCIPLQPGAAPAVHMHDDLDFGAQGDFIGVGDAFAGEAVQGQHLGGEVVYLYQLPQVAGDVIHFLGIQGPYFGPRHRTGFDQVELRIDSQVDVRIFQYPLEARQKLADIVMSGLNVDEQKSVCLLCPGIDLFDDFIRHDHAVFSCFARCGLRRHRDQVQSGLYLQGRIRRFPEIHFLLQSKQHLFFGGLAQNPHLPAKRVAVEGYDALMRQDGPWQSFRDVYRPPVLSGELGVFASPVFDLGCRSRYGDLFRCGSRGRWSSVRRGNFFGRMGLLGIDHGRSSCRPPGIGIVSVCSGQVCIPVPRQSKKKSDQDEHPIDSRPIG